MLNGLATPLIVDASGAITYTQQLAGAGGLGQLIYRGSNDSIPGKLYFGKSRGTFTSPTIVQNGDTTGQIDFGGYDGTTTIRTAFIFSQVDGTPGTNDMPGRLVFSTTADGASSPTERMRIDNAGNVGIGATPSAGQSFRVSKAVTGATTSNQILSSGAVQSDVTIKARYYNSFVSTQAASFTLADLVHFGASQSTFGLGSVVTNQKGFEAESTLTGATNNYGFYSNIAAGSGRFNFYANGTAANFFAGDMQLDKTVTAGGTTGAQTINKNAGTVNFAAAATSLVVTDDRVTTSSIIICTVGTNDTTLKSVAAVAGAGSFTLHASAAATAETRVNFLIIN
jgi:hypothetical protein